jgi:hypothetical protein
VKGKMEVKELIDEKFRLMRETTELLRRILGTMAQGELTEEEYSKPSRLGKSFN